MMAEKFDLPDDALVSVSPEHQLLGELPGWRTEGWVGLARTQRCEEEGKVTVDINFEPAFVTVKEAAVLLRVSPSTVRRLVQQGKLDVRQFGAERLITWESLVVLAEIEARSSE